MSEVFVRKYSLTDKLVSYFTLISLTALGLVGYLSYQNAKDALFMRTFDQLTSVRVVKKKQIENFFKDRISEITTYSRLEQVNGIINMVNSFKYQKMNDSAIYIFNDETFINNFILSSRYYNRAIFSISNKSKKFYQIIKSDKPILSYLFKDTGTLNIIKNEVLKNNKTIIREDYNIQEDKQIIYLGIPIIDSDKHVAGVLILDLKTDIINIIMLENNPQDGLGKSGESYLIGSDKLMRSKSRFLENSVLKTKVETEGSLSAISGNEGTSFYRDYRHIEVLGSYSKLLVDGLNWYILAEIDLDEANEPVNIMRNHTLVLTILISAIVFIITYSLSKRITVPITKLTKAAIKIGEGSHSEQVEITSFDEIGTLTYTFNTMVNRLQEQEAELIKERTKRSLASLDAMENERKRLSRELHDGLGQSLTALKLKLENIDIEKTERTLQIIREVKKSIDNTINDIRHISNNLMPPVLNDFGVVNAIRNLCDDLNEFSKIKIEFISDLHTLVLNSRSRIYLFRIAQESLNNVLQHSDATNVRVELKIDGDFIILVVSDNGKGFKTEKATEGNGLYNMKERANLLNGAFEINSEPGTGTEIIVKIPVK